MTDKNTPEKLDAQDNEAAGLLMLFSTESHRLNPTNNQPVVEVKKEKKYESVPISTDVPAPAPTPASAPTTVSSTSTKDLHSSTNTTAPIITQTSSHEMHRRTSSVTRDIQSLRMDQITTSPGPAAAALVSGNGSNKAMVAAAALAAAAATPLPIFHKTETSNNSETQSVSPTSNSTQHLTSSNVTEVKDIYNSQIKLEKDNISNKIIETVPEFSNKKDGIEKDSIKKETVTEEIDTPPSYAVDPDSGIISCICGYDHDDGLTIQCDTCFRWQHLVCMGFESINDTPDDFQCNLCNKNLKVDASNAKKLQESYLKEEKSKRKRNPYSNDKNKDSNKNIGAAQFKKRKTDENVNVYIGINKYKTLYYPIDYFVYKSSSVKSLFSQLPELTKKNKSIIRLDKSGLNKSLFNGNHLNIKSASENAKVKFTGISKLGLYTNKIIKENLCVSILSGEIDLKQNYMSEKVNKYWLLGSAKPSVYFHPNLPIVIDQRALGNHTRFIRKSCRPNCEIRTIIVNKEEVVLGIFSIREIKPDQEITLPWEWDTDHPILRIINNLEPFENMNSEMKIVLINSIQSILDLTDCGCSNSSTECIINKVKKLSAYLQRNTRKNNISNLSPTPNQKYISIDERYEDRNKIILNSISKSENLLESTDDEIIIKDQFKKIKNTDNKDDDTTIESSTTNQIEDNDNNYYNKDKKDDNNTSFTNPAIVNFKFKPKAKNTLYNLHILPKKFELLKKYAHVVDGTMTMMIQGKEREVKSTDINNNNSSSDNIKNNDDDDDDDADDDADDDDNNNSNQEGHELRVENDMKMPIPVEVSARVLNKLEKNNSGENTLSNVNNNNKLVAKVDAEEKPKVVKKFSLADYKKKKTG